MDAHGKAIKYGDNVDTDVIIPARYLNTSEPIELANHCMEDIDKSFVKRVVIGDLIVAGKNFGCGSSREHAPIAIKASGISCVIAQTFARIFYRNAINIGLPIIECAEAAQDISEGEIVSVEYELEIGTGTGIIPFTICSKVSSIVATDISSEMVRVAKQKLLKTKIKNIDFQIQDSYNLTLKDKSFDIVIASNLLHLLYQPEKPLNEVKRVMKADGIFIAPTLCAGENTKSKIIASIIGTLSGFKVVNKWSINEYKNMLTNNGFIITRTVIIYDKIPLAYAVMKNNIATKT